MPVWAFGWGVLHLALSPDTPLFMKPFLHLLLLALAGLEIVGTSLESISLSTGQQNALVALLAVYIPLSHHLLGKAIQ